MELSSRLKRCADMIEPGHPVVDIGTDHCMLPIYLLQSGVSHDIIASDINAKPLAAAQENCRACGVADEISFCLSPGLKNVAVHPGTIAVCAGMGGDNIIGIIDQGKDQRGSIYQWVLQPQSAIPDVRRYLLQHGYVICTESFATDDRFTYCIIKAQSGSWKYVAFEEYYPHGEIDYSDANLKLFLRLSLNRLRRSISGIRSAHCVDAAKLEFYQNAYAVLDHWTLEHLGGL